MLRYTVPMFRRGTLGWVPGASNLKQMTRFFSFLGFLEFLGFLPPGLGGILSVSRFPLHTTQHFFVLRTYTV